MNVRQDLKIVFFGTSEFGAIILEKMVQEKIVPVLIVSTPDMPTNRGQVMTPSPVKITAQKHGIPVKEKLEGVAPDLIVLAAYGKILPKEVLTAAKYGALNVHPSPLPKYRGPSPVQTALLNGDTETGVTIMLMDEKIDHGPIVANSKFKIQNSKFTYSELHNKLAEIGAELLIQTIPAWVAGNIKPIPQDDSNATYTKIFKKEDGHIDCKNPALYIERQVRALFPWPGTYALWKNKIVKILEASVAEGNGEAGKTFLASTGKLGVYTRENALIIEKLQLEGKKAMPSKEFLLGYKKIIGTTLC